MAFLAWRACVYNTDVAADVQTQQLAEPSGIEDEPEDGCVPLSNARHELFAQFRALGGYQIGEAYTRAGGKATGVQAKRQGCKIAYLPATKIRILYLKHRQAQAMQDENVMGKREILQELKTNMHLGRQVKGGLPASNRALEMIGIEEHGMFVQRREMKTGKIDTLEGLDPNQLIDFIQKAADRIKGLDLDADALAAACGIERRPEIGDGGTTGDSTPSSVAEVPDSDPVSTL